MNRKVCWGLGLSAAFALAAYAWVPRLATIFGWNSFLQSDMVFSLGLGLAAALLCSSILPDSMVLKAEEIWLQGVAKRLFLFPALMTALFAALLFINRNIIHQFQNSADEHSCYFMAELIRMGKWWVRPPELSEFFNVVHVGNRDGKWFSVYPPGWPLLWAAGLQLKISDWINPLLTVFSLPLIYGAARRLFSSAVALGGILLVIFSPFFLFTGASYFSHATCLFTMAVFIYAFVRWQEVSGERGRFAWAALAAAACGYGLITRYLTMAAFALPFWVWHYWPLLLGRKKWRKSDVVPVVILTLFMAGLLYQNYAVTGKPFKAPNKYDKSWERLGFKGDYSMAEGVLYILFRFFYLMDYSAPLLVVLFIAGIFRRPPKEPVLTRLVRYSFFYGSFVYFFYYSWGGNQYGPRYWWESFPFLGITLADQIARAWREGNESLKKFLIGVLIVSVPAAVWCFYKQGSFLEKESRERKALYVLSEQTLKEPSIVFIHGFLGDSLVMAEEDAVRNSPRMDSRVLYAHDLGVRNKELEAFFPDRRYYRGTYDRQIKRAVLESL